MALWGNNDAVGSAGTVSLAYETGVLAGAGTSFGISGGCSVGDVIKIKQCRPISKTKTWVLVEDQG